MRKFEKISLEEYHKCQIGYDETWYNNLELPKRSTKHSAGYDFHCPFDIILKAKECTKVPTLVKVQIPEDEILMIVPRSSLGFKHNIRLSNTIGIIDSDYYGNENNEGHMYAKFYNPNDYDIKLKAGDKMMQGIFVKYGITIDDEADGERTGGIGSTGK